MTYRELTAWWAFTGLGVTAVVTGNRWWALGALAEAVLGLTMSLRARRKARRSQ